MRHNVILTASKYKNSFDCRQVETCKREIPEAYLIKYLLNRLDIRAI